MQRTASLHACLPAYTNVYARINVYGGEIKNPLNDFE